MPGDRITVVDPADVPETEPVRGLAVRSPLRSGGRRLDSLVVAGGDRTDWHRRAGPLYGWIRAGRGLVEYGPREVDAVDVVAGEFLRIPAGLVHRYVADDEGFELLAVVDGPPEAFPAAPPTGVADAALPAVVGTDELVPAAGSPNLVRETPFPDEDVLLLRVRAAGGAAAGWHHHGDNVYFGYAVDGPSETEYGPCGDEVARIGVDECFGVPRGLVHRDTNPTDETHTGIIWLCGGEPRVVNVDGPA